MELLKERRERERERNITLPNDSEFFPHLGTLGWYDMRNCYPDVAALVDTLQNQLEERGRFSFSLKLFLGILFLVPQKSDNLHSQ